MLAMSADKLLVRQGNLFLVFVHDIRSKNLLWFCFGFCHGFADYVATMFPVQEVRAFSLQPFYQGRGKTVILSTIVSCSYV